MRNFTTFFSAGRENIATYPRSFNLLVMFFFLGWGLNLNAQFSVNLTVEEPMCFGLPDGSITATASGGASPYSYLWSTGNMGPVLDGITSGNYSVTVTDDNGASVVENVFVSQPTLVTATLVADECSSPITITAFGGGGVPPYMYNWTNGEDTQSISVNPGTYCVTLTDSHYCGTVECITVNNVPLNVSVITQGLSCPDANDGSVTAVVSGGVAPFSYLWNTGATTQSINNLVPGAYTVTVTDANGCTDTAVGVVTDQTPISIFTNATNPTCINDSNGSASASATGGTPPYTYAWSNGQFGTFIGNLTAGTYVVTVTDSNGCTEVASVVLSPTSNLVVGATVTPETCDGFNNGTATAVAASGIQPYTYFWSNGSSSSSIDNLAPGNYTVTVTDAVNCMGTATVTVLPAPDFNISLTNTSVSTCSANNGTATVTVTAGVGPFTYNWNTGANTPQITGLPGGVYAVTVTDSNGCQLFGSTNVFEPLPVDVTVSATPLVCAGDNNGSASISITGGTPPFQYFWSNGANTPFLNNLSAGTYSLTIVDAFGCTDIDQATINEAPAISVSVAGTQIVCGTGNTGSATAFVSGGTPPFTYMWSNGANTPSVSGLPEGTYFVTILDANNCMATGMITINVIEDLLLTMSADDVDCFGESTGAASVSVSGGDLPYSYLWSNGSTAPSINNVVAGTYTVTVTDANGCAFSNSVTVNQPNDLNLNITTSTLTVCVGENDAQATAIASGGTPPYSFEWNTGATTAFIANLAAGTYTVTVTDANECQEVETVVISNAPTIDVIINGTNIVCGAGNTGSATAIVIGGTFPFSYAWSNGANTQVINDLAEGTYSVTVTDANGCEATEQITIDIIDDIVATITALNVSCFDAIDGSATVMVSGGTAPYTYAWSNGANTAAVSGLAPGVYTVTITDANDCDIVETVNINKPPLLSVSIQATNLLCVGETTGSATAIVSGGTPAYSYEWNNGETTATISNLAAGTYTVTVTDANECEATASVTISESPELMVSVNAPEIVCGAENTGIAEVVVNGGVAPFTYSWNTGEATESIDELPSGTYSVTVTDANGCTGSAEATIEIISDLALNLVERDVLCNGDMNGGMLAEPSGGDLPYTYAWNTGEMTNELINVGPGVYTVTVTDANGCTVSASGMVTEPTELTAGVNGVDVLCIGEETGSATATASGGTPPYSFEWSNGETTPSVSGLPAGTYTVTITDENLCTAEASVTIDEPNDELDVNVNTPLIECGGTDSGSASAIVSGGTPPYTYQWSNGGTTSEINNIPAGTYEITVTDANGCAVVGQTFTVSELPELTLNLDVTNIVCSNASEGAIEVTPSGGTPPFNYSWNNGLTNALISDLSPGSYEVTVTDANNCEATGNAVITQVAALEVDISSNPVSCVGGNDGTATVSVSGGMMPYDYSWSTGDESATITGLTAGTYSVTVTGAAGCVGIASIVVNEPTPIAITTSSTPASCAGGNDGTASITISGGTPAYTAEWSNGAAGTSINGLAAGTYSVTVTDANECTATASVEVGEPTPVVVTTALDNETCVGENQGSATATASGGTPPYTYEWSDGQSTATAVNLAAGTYTVTATDANECTATSSITISTFDAPTCVISLVNEVVLGGDGELEVAASGGTGPYTYLWSDGQTTAVATGLNGGMYSVTVTDANGCETTCDYNLVALSGLGDYFWEDIDHDGIQDPDEPGFEGVKVKLKDETGMVIDSTFTDADGFYQFIGLQPGTYSVMFTLPDGYQYTELNAGGDDTLDNDVDLSTMEMTQTVTLAPGEFNWTLDAGVDLIPYDIIFDPCNCLNNATTDDNGQFSEEIRIVSYPNETWTILEQVGMYLFSSPDPPAAPIPVPVGTQLVETPAGSGEYFYEFKVIDAQNYMALTITNGFDTLDIENICFYPNINMDEIPEGELCITDDVITLSANPSIPGDLTFYIDGNPIDEIDPAALGVGSYEFIAELVPDDPEECTTTIITNIVIIEDCVAAVGNYVWNDVDQDGIQDPNEPGIEDVKVIITGVDEFGPYTDTTYTDEDGFYLFEVFPGTFKLTFCQPDGYLPSPQNEGSDDEVDSDADPVTGMTDLFVLESDEVDLTWDAGFYSKCDNLTDPGTISGYQFLCGPGNDPDPIGSVTLPSGGSGDIEYLWMMSTIPGPFDPAVWVPIPDSNSPTYDPGPLFETTYYARCARRECCITYLESNIVIIEVGDVAVANINGPSLLCVDEATTFYAGSTGAGAVIEWDFGPGATPMTATGTPVDVTFSSFGNFTITLMVTEGGCTSTAYKEITVTNSPVYCPSGLAIDVNVVNEQKEVSIEWQVEPQDEIMIYTVEHSIDGQHFEAIGLVVEEEMTIDGMNYYSFIHEEPKPGRNYYRVKVTDNDGASGHSEIGEAIIYGDSRLMMVFPNPVQDQLVLELFETFEDMIEIRLISVEGRILQRLQFPAETKRVPMGMSNYPAGTYLLQVRYGELDVKTFKVIKQE